jgi:hypothetical protein
MVDSATVAIDTSEPEKVKFNASATVADGSITTAKLADDAVTTDKIADGAVTNGKLATAAKTVAIELIIDGGGATITTGVKGYIEIPFACTIIAARALADQSGSIVVDIWKDTYANFPPVNADSITASAPVTITTSNKSQDTTLTGWTTSVAAGDILGFNVDSVTSHQRVTISLTVVKT